MLHSKIQKIVSINECVNIMSNLNQTGDLNANFQHIYESLIFEDIKTTSGNFSPSLKADLQRKIAAQLYYSNNSGEMFVYS
jgi:hypothetical protein